MKNNFDIIRYMLEILNRNDISEKIPHEDSALTYVFIHESIYHRKPHSGNILEIYRQEYFKN